VSHQMGLGTRIESYVPAGVARELESVTGRE